MVLASLPPLPSQFEFFKYSEHRKSVSTNVGVLRKEEEEEEEDLKLPANSESTLEFK